MSGKCRRIGFVTIILFFTVSFAILANPLLGGDESRKPAAVTATGGGFLSGYQLQFRDQISSALADFQAGKGVFPILLILGSAFLYGLLHAAGPGHRKTIVFSLFLSRRTGFFEPLAAGLLSAIVHAFTGVGLIGVLSVMRGAIAGLGEADTVGLWMDGLSFTLLIVISLVLLVMKVRSLLLHTGHTHSHRGKGLYSITFFSSLVPCPGVIMVLMVALYFNVVVLGLLAVLSMSLGMGVVVSIAGYLAWFGREGLFLRLKENGERLGQISAGLELVSYFLLFTFSLYAAWPFLISLGTL